MSAAGFGAFMIIVYFCLLSLELFNVSDRGSFLVPELIEFSIAQIIILIGWDAPLLNRAIPVFKKGRQSGIGSDFT